MSKDDSQLYSEEIQKLTDTKVAEIDAVVSQKEQEISQI